MRAHVARPARRCRHWKSAAVLAVDGDDAAAVRSGGPAPSSRAPATTRDSLLASASVAAALQHGEPTGRSPAAPTTPWTQTSYSSSAAAISDERLLAPPGRSSRSEGSSARSALRRLRVDPARPTARGENSRRLPRQEPIDQDPGGRQIPASAQAPRDWARTRSRVCVPIEPVLPRRRIRFMQTRYDRSGRSRPAARGARAFAAPHAGA